MKAWVELDDAGRQFLVRQGVGRVTAVAAVDPEGSAYRVEIACEVPQGWSRSIRYTVQAQIASSHPLLPRAMDAEDTSQRVAWTVTWHRHEGVPAELPITSLDLTTDTVSRLVALEAVDDTVTVESLEMIGRRDASAEGRRPQGENP